MESAQGTTLRTLLDERANAAFVEGGIADTVVTSESNIHFRIAAMHRALVAHDALVSMISLTGAGEGPWQSTLLNAIEKALEGGLISPRESKYLKYFNTEANRAKHDRALPF